jgi:adenylate kinase family enzyme
MPPIPPLASFGRRIMICGPSNSGKSTLAVAIARKLAIPPVHLDQLRHRPNTDWVQRTDAEFARLHDEAVLLDSWAMDGNYTSTDGHSGALMPNRLKRATGIILLGDNRWTSLARYFRRTLFQGQRAGALEGALDSVKWEMIRWIMVNSPRNLARYREDLPKSGLPFLEVHGMSELNRLYTAWSLPRG